MIPIELAKQFARGNGTLFIGAGLSMGSGLCSWKELVDPLRADIPECPADASLLDVAQHYEDTFSRSALLRSIKETFNRDRLPGKRYEPSGAHRALLSLPVRRIYTTNFDDLLDQTLRESNVPYIPIRETDDLSMIDGREMQLIKLHGDMEVVKSITVTSSDYESYLLKKPALARLLASELQTKTVLFLGYSFQDQDSRIILTQVSAEAKGMRGNLYTIQNQPPKAVSVDLERRGIQVISLQLGKEHPNALCDWLQEFARAVRNHGVAIASIPKVVPIAHDVPTVEGELVGRDDDLRRVVAGLRMRYPIVAIEGPPGVGKRRLALEATRCCNSQRVLADADDLVYEFISWLPVKTNPATSWLDDALNAIALVTGNLRITQMAKDEMERKRVEVNRLLRSYKILVIIDNYDEIKDAELQTWIEQIPYPSKVLLTTSSPVRMAWPIGIEGLDTASSLALVRQFAKSMDIGPVKQASDRDLLPLVKRTKGNPQILKLTLGIVKGGMANLRDWAVRTRGQPQESEEIIAMLFEWAWSLLSPHSETVLRATCVFADMASIGKEALQVTSGCGNYDFDEAFEKLRSFHLIERNMTSDEAEFRYQVHPVVQRLVRVKLEERAELEAGFRERCAGYYLQFVKKAARRAAPAPRYWTSLVTEKMQAIDGEWASIEEAIRWSLAQGRDEDFIEFILHLVHYMDSRFLNRERVEYVQQAAMLLHTLGRKEDEALLRIDSLGWTYVEEGAMARACEQIDEGVRLLDELEAAEAPHGTTREAKGLRALAYAWKARAACEQGKTVEARQSIDPALQMTCEPWVNARVRMVAGDIELSALEYKRALGFYEECKAQMEIYGGEGDGYQTNPRIGLAQLCLGDLNKAEERFLLLRENKVIKVGQFYADYGLALIKYLRQEIPSARAVADEIESQLQKRKRTRSDLMIGLFNKLYAEFEPAKRKPFARARGEEVSVVDPWDEKRIGRSEVTAMKAVVLHEYGGPEKLKWEELADPVAGEGELLVRVAASSVNPVDYKMRSGAAKALFPVEFPGVLGRDAAGIVREVGPGVTGFEPGDKVMALTRRAYAELVVVKAAEAAHLPEGLDLVEAAALPLVTLTGEQLITRGTKIGKGQTVVVAGAMGGVGRSAVWTAKQAGAVVIAGVRKSQLKEAAALGADEVLALDDKEAMGKLGFVDAVADAVGHETAETLLGKVKQGGVFASVLGPPANAKMHPTVNVVPVMVEPDAAMLRKLAEDVLAKKLVIPIDRMIAMADAAEGQAAAEKGGIGKVLLLA